jgi:hypothetical protein
MSVVVSTCVLVSIVRDLINVLTLKCDGSISSVSTVHARLCSHGDPVSAKECLYGQLFLEVTQLLITSLKFCFHGTNKRSHLCSNMFQL